MRDQLEQLKMVNLSSIKLTEEVAAVVHNILHIVLTRLFRLRMVKLDQSSLCAAIQAQLFLSSLLSQLKPFVKAYLSIIDQEKVKQPLSETDSLCAIIDGEEEEESSKSEEDEEDDRLQTMQALARNLFLFFETNRAHLYVHTSS